MDWTSYIIPTYLAEIVIYVAVTVVGWLRKLPHDGGWSKPSTSIATRVITFTSSLVLPFWLPQLFLNSAHEAGFYIMLAVFLGGFACGIALKAHLGWTAVQWKGDEIRCNRRGGIVTYRPDQLAEVKIGYFTVRLRFNDGSRIWLDRYAKGIITLLQSLYVGRPIFNLPTP